MKAHIGQHTDKSPHMREHILEHAEESTEEESRCQNREAHFAQACAVETCMDMSQEPFCVKIYRKNAGPSLQEVFCGNLQEQYRSPIPREPFCVEIYRESVGPGFRARHFVWKCTGKNAHGDVTRAILCNNLPEKCRTRIPGTA